MGFIRTAGGRETPDLQRFQVTTALYPHPAHHTLLLTEGQNDSTENRNAVCLLACWQPAQCIWDAASCWGEMRVTPCCRLCPPALPHQLCLMAAGRAATAEKLPCLHGNEQGLPPWPKSAGMVINGNFATHCISVTRPARSISLRSVKAAAVAHDLTGSGNANSFPSEFCSISKIHVCEQRETNII